MIRTVHAFEDILRNVKCVAKLVFNGDSVSSYLFDVQICGLGEKLIFFELFGVPERLSRAFYWFGCFPAFFISANSCAQDERCCIDELFRDLLLWAGFASSRKVSYVHSFAAWVIVFFHNFDHFVAMFVHFHKGELDIFLGEFSHLVLNFEPVRCAVRIGITTGITYVFTVTWSIGYVES